MSVQEIWRWSVRSLVSPVVTYEVCAIEKFVLVVYLLQLGCHLSGAAAAAPAYD